MYYRHLFLQGLRNALVSYCNVDYHKLESDNGLEQIKDKEVVYSRTPGSHTSKSHQFFCSLTSHPLNFESLFELRFILSF